MASLGAGIGSRLPLSLLSTREGGLPPVRVGRTHATILPAGETAGAAIDPAKPFTGHIRDVAVAVEEINKK